MSTSQDALYHLRSAGSYADFIKNETYVYKPSDWSWASHKPMTFHQLTDIRIASLLRFASESEKTPLLELKSDWDLFKERFAHDPADHEVLKSLFNRVVDKANLAEIACSTLRPFASMTDSELFNWHRKSSLEYLTDLDRGIWGWEKVDRKLRNLMFYLHRNPHLYHWGESCEGHLNLKDTEAKVSVGGGYFNVAHDSSPEALAIIEAIQAALASLPYVKVTIKSHERSVRCSIQVDREKIVAEGALDEPALRERLAYFHQAINRVESILEQTARDQPEPWDREDTRRADD